MPLSTGPLSDAILKGILLLKIELLGMGIENKEKSKGREPGFNLPLPENGDSWQRWPWREESQASAWAI